MRKHSVLSLVTPVFFMMTNVLLAQTRYDSLDSPYESSDGGGLIEFTGITIVDFVLTAGVYFGIVIGGIWLFFKFLQEFFR